MAEPKVRLVVLNFNGGDDVLSCVGRLTAVDWPRERLEVVVVDNASTDGSIEAIEEAFRQVRIVRSPVNLGFPANNLALGDLDAIDYVGLVNNDAFVDPGFLRPLVATLEADPGLGAACPKILLADLSETGLDVINNVGNHLVDGWFGADRGLNELDRGQYDTPSDVFSWCGAAVLFPVGYLRDVGLFDERLFLYYEDLDLAWQGRARGWRYRTAPTAVVRHRLGGTSVIGSPTFQYHVERNRLVVLVKNAPWKVAVWAPFRHLLATGGYLRQDVLRPLVQGRRPSPATTVHRLRAWFGFAVLVPHALRERRRIARSAVLSPEARLNHGRDDLPHSSPV